MKHLALAEENLYLRARLESLEGRVIRELEPVLKQANGRLVYEVSALLLTGAVIGGSAVFLEMTR